jgi:L-threonylcarbamoyladenylate synthase
MSLMHEEAELLYASVEGTVERVVQLLEEGQLVVLPCDTIYGLSGVVGQTLSQLQELKPGQQYAVLATLEQAQQLCEVPYELTKHWPCPLTAILPNRDKSGSTAIRVPKDPFIQTLLTRLGKPIYSTSVNDQGYAITNITDIIFTYKQKVHAIVVDPNRRRDTPSTLLDCTTKPYTLLRCGEYDASALLT